MKHTAKRKSWMVQEEIMWALNSKIRVKWDYCFPWRFETRACRQTCYSPTKENARAFLCIWMMIQPCPSIAADPVAAILFPAMQAYSTILRWSEKFQPQSDEGIFSSMKYFSLFQFLRLGKLMVFYTKNVMRLLLFLQRVAFICNLLFILCVIIRHTQNFISNDQLKQTVIILGWVVSFILNWIVNIWEAVLLFNRKIAIGPKLMRTFNFLVFLFQIFYFFIAAWSETNRV